MAVQWLCYLHWKENDEEKQPSWCAILSKRPLPARWRKSKQRWLDFEQVLCRTWICLGLLHSCYTDTEYRTDMLQSCSSASSSHRGTIQHNATKHAKGNARWGAPHFDKQRCEKKVESEYRYIPCMPLLYIALLNALMWKGRGETTLTMRHAVESDHVHDSVNAHVRDRVNTRDAPCWQTRMSSWSC